MTDASLSNITLYGHDEVEAALKAEAIAGKLPHGLILAGPRGIGKGLLARRLAHFLLGADKDEGAARRIQAGAHSDLLILEPVFDEKKKEYAREISVDQAREIPVFLSLTPGEAEWRVVIVDAADALNNNSANALLKILEEPPAQAVLILIAHAPGKLLPTIRSRCRMVKLQPPAQEEFRKAVLNAEPEMDATTIPALAELSSRSPGLALDMLEHGLDWYSELLDLVSALPQLDTLKLHSFTERIQHGNSHANWRLLSRLVLVLFERIAKQGVEISSEPITENEAAVLARLAKLHSPAVWAAKWQQASEQFLLTERLHLEYKQTFIAFVHGIASKEGFQLGAA